MTISGKCDSEGKFSPMFKDDLIICMIFNVWIILMINIGIVPNHQHLKAYDEHERLL